MFPRFYGNDDTYWGRRLEIEYGLYIGVVPLLLALWALYARKRGSWLPEQRFFIWLLGISFLLALGRASPFRLIGLEPSLWVFSAPARWLLFTSIALSLFAAIGFDSILQKRVYSVAWLRRVKHVGVALMIVSMLSTALLLYFEEHTQYLWQGVRQYAPVEALGRPDRYYQEKIASLITSASNSSISIRSPFTLIPLISILSLPYLLGRKNTRGVLMTLATIDLLIVAATTSPLVAWKDILKPPATIYDLPDAILQKKARLFSVREGGDTGAIFTNPASRADAEVRKQQRLLLLPLIHAQFNLPGVEWPAALDLVSQAKALEELKVSHSDDLISPEKAAELNIGAALTSSANGDVLIRELAFEPRATVINQEGETVGTATRQEIHPGKIQVEGLANAAATLIVRDTWYPGWQ
ncbi:MAG: hypothetical protein ACRD4B_10735, partial [Acidobacteriota bacterium]